MMINSIIIKLLKKNNLLNMPSPLKWQGCRPWSSYLICTAELYYKKYIF